MRALCLFRVLSVVSLVALAALPARANIYMDENFEDSSPFTDLNWPIQDNTTAPTAPQIASNQGINVRSTDNTSANTLPKVVINNTGTLSTAAAYSGTQCVQLAPGQSVAVNGTAAYVNAAMNWLVVVQFAVSVNAATLALPVGTQVGHFRENWSTDGSGGLSTVEVVYQLNLVRNTSGGVDVIVNNNSTKVGEIAASGGGGWAMITVIADKNPDVAETWEAWDPLTSTYKGPQPTGDPFHGTGTYATLAQGIYVFVNSNTAGNLITPAGLGGGWCTNPDANATFLLNWEVASENGGTLFVDEFYWSHGMHQNGKAVDPLTQEGSARMNAFTGPVPAEVQHWSLYD